MLTTGTRIATYKAVEYCMTATANRTGVYRVISGNRPVVVALF
jgi:hypothetical protein